jgi:double-strand break repair protein MRE11
MTPIPLRTVRPFVMEEVILSEVAEEENILLTDKMAIQMFLRRRVSGHDVVTCGCG